MTLIDPRRTGAPEGEPVDLTSCDREPIHALGRVQSFGVLFAVTTDWIVARVSENIESFIGCTPEDALGLPIEDILPPETIQAIRGATQGLFGEDAVERLFRVRLTADGPPHDLALYLSDRLFVIEAEPSEHEQLDSINTVRAMVARLQKASGADAFQHEAVRQLRALTGFDRVMLYKFGHDGSGEVVGESVAPGQEPYLGLRYPASDIPKQARALYLRNWLRLIADAKDEGVMVLPTRGTRGEPLDLSMSVLRAVSPIHLEYLSNMGVSASMSVSVIVDGKLWGLFACHHARPRRISLERRTAAELFGQMFSWVLDGRLRDAETEYEARARDVAQGVMRQVAAEGSTMEGVFRQARELTGLVRSDGVGVWIDGQANLHGATPTHEEFEGLVRFLNAAPAGEAFATDDLSSVHDPAHDYRERVSGVLAIPISRQPRDYLVFFRREVARSVTWAGDPDKPVTQGPNGVRLTPRKSFEAWREVVRGQSDPWTEADLRIAEQLRATLLEVILQMTDAAEKERRSGQERQELLIAELNHRVRNILGLIRGLIGQSKGGAQDVESFASTIGGRIQALARAHDQITTMNWGPGSLRTLIETEVEAYLDGATGAGGRVDLDGPDVLLEPQAFSVVALVIHELTTNAAKYGALVDRSGRVEVAWTIDRMGRLQIDWRETGGPPVQAPTRRGFGSTVIERSVPFELKGEAEIAYALTGLQARFAIPASFVAATGPSVAPAGDEVGSAPPANDRLSGHVLVVEDNMLIALDAEDMLAEIGAERVTVATSVAEAARILDDDRPDSALLDVNLGAETSLPIAERLAAEGVPFIFASGYGDRVPRPDAIADVPVVSKPYTADTLRRAFATAAT